MMALGLVVAANKEAAERDKEQQAKKPATQAKRIREIALQKAAAYGVSTSAAIPLLLNGKRVKQSYVDLNQE